MDEVRHIAMLSRISFSDEELERLRHEFRDIIRWVDKLHELNTEGLPPGADTETCSTSFRKDLTKPSHRADVWRTLAPWCDEEGFKVPRVVE